MYRSVALPVLFALLFLPAAAADPAAPLTVDENTEKASGESLWIQIQALYESAKKAGDIDAGSVTEWLKTDYEGMGDWEYRVIEVTSKDSSVLETYLNAEGQDRWEVFWVREGGGNFTFFLKRPVRSYLRSVPLTDLLKLIPGGGGE
ncbi:MAG: hypothetical protein IFK94_12755 [Acidobacteria bacterium]|uniref:Uncharacterized protein n=1 Tax=Candidatus Polarisedimenticola svalbardensis TaxID=2886004 RepID=A0A8J6Y440_9BACT|nr:hypothetical protein [Candidatus Polarisedimenticola svalbardensis]